MSLPPGVLRGEQEPRICSLPPFDVAKSGRNAVALAAEAGLVLDPWQRFVLEAGLRRRGGKWAAFEVCLIVARQNGKGAVLEALELAALLSARPDPQVWYTSTAGGPGSIQLGRVRKRGFAGDDPSLAFMEWSADEHGYDVASRADWARANPGLHTGRISEEYIAKELAALGPVAFARERLSVGDYPADGGAWEVISQDAWNAAAVPGGWP
jgi:phage terminase large subunit-like protein